MREISDMNNQNVDMNNQKIENEYLILERRVFQSGLDCSQYLCVYIFNVKFKFQNGKREKLLYCFDAIISLFFFFCRQFYVTRINKKNLRSQLQKNQRVIITRMKRGRIIFDRRLQQGKDSTVDTCIKKKIRDDVSEVRHEFNFHDETNLFNHRPFPLISDKIALPSFYSPFIFT